MYSPCALVGPQCGQLTVPEAGTHARYRIVSAYMIAAQQPNQPTADQGKRGTTRFESDQDRGELGALREDFGDLRGPEMMKEEICDDDVRRFRGSEIFEHVLRDLIFPPAELCNRLSRFRSHNILLVDGDNGDVPPMPREATAEPKHQTAVARAKLDDPPRRIDCMTAHAPSHDIRMQHHCIEEPKVAARPHGGGIIGWQNVEQLGLEAAGEGHHSPAPSLKRYGRFETTSSRR